MDDLKSTPADRSGDGQQGERQARTFRKDGYNGDLRGMPVDIEPVPRDAAGAAIDIRSDTMPDDGIVVVHDDDDEILDAEKADAEKAP